MTHPLDYDALKEIAERVVTERATASDALAFTNAFDPATVLSLLSRLRDLEVERDEARKVPISLDTLPFWPWLWADPCRDDPDQQRDMAERRLRVNYETARAPIPDQYALVHRWDLTTLFHELWHKRAKASLVDDYKSRALSAERELATAREASLILKGDPEAVEVYRALRRERDEAERLLRQFAADNTPPINDADREWAAAVSGRTISPLEERVLGAESQRDEALSRLVGLEKGLERLLYSLRLTASLRERREAETAARSLLATRGDQEASLVSDAPSGEVRP